jgi:hypothetical protein
MFLAVTPPFLGPGDYSASSTDFFRCGKNSMREEHMREHAGMFVSPALLLRAADALVYKLLPRVFS